MPYRRRGVWRHGLLFASLLCAPCVAPTDFAAQGDGAEAEIVRLPPYVTSALRIDRNPWRYAKVDDFEILTRADDLDTAEVVQAVQRGKALEDLLIPAEWRTAPAVPYAVIVDDADLKAVANNRMRTDPMRFDRPADALTYHEYARTTRVSNESFGAGDRDTYAINLNVHGHGYGGLNGTVTLERLARSTPPLPGWLMAGLVGRNSGVFRGSFSRAEGEPGVVGPGLLWVSVGETARLLNAIERDRKQRRRTEVELLPLDGLFAETPPPADKLALWESEAALLVHWALLGPGRTGSGRAALIALVERARRAPVSEAVFVECFGVSYETMRATLAAYLVEQLPQVTRISAGMDDPPATPDFKPATSDQIGRILGDWIRMRAALVEDSDPVLSRQLLSAANRVLERAYRDDNGLPPDVAPSHPGTEPRHAPPADAGVVVTLSPVAVTANRIHDALLLAVYGLYEYQLGAKDQARELLEKAARAKTLRTEALRILALLRYEEALAAPAGAGGKLSIRQVTSILEPLRVCLGRTPGSNAYRLFIETWEHADTRPSRDDMAVVNEAVRRFPRNAPLVYHAARLAAASGYAADARALIDCGVTFATPQSGPIFVQLRNSLPPP